LPLLVLYYVKKAQTEPGSNVRVLLHPAQKLNNKAQQHQCNHNQQLKN